MYEKKGYIKNMSYQGIHLPTILVKKKINYHRMKENKYISQKGGKRDKIAQKGGKVGGAKEEPLSDQLSNSLSTDIDS